MRVVKTLIFFHIALETTKHFSEVWLWSVLCALTDFRIAAIIFLSFRFKSVVVMVS